MAGQVRDRAFESNWVRDNHPFIFIFHISHSKAPKQHILLPHYMLEWSMLCGMSLL